MILFFTFSSFFPVSFVWLFAVLELSSFLTDTKCLRELTPCTGPTVVNGTRFFTAGLALGVVGNLGLTFFTPTADCFTLGVDGLELSLGQLKWKTIKWKMKNKKYLIYIECSLTKCSSNLFCLRHFLMVLRPVWTFTISEVVTDCSAGDLNCVIAVSRFFQPTVYKIGWIQTVPIHHKWQEL